MNKPKVILFGDPKRPNAIEALDRFVDFVSDKVEILSNCLETACPVDFLVARDEGYCIVLQEGEGTLLLGREDFAARLERYLVARDHLEKGLEVDLRFGDRVTVRRLGS